MLSRREFAMCVGTCIAAAIIGECKLLEFAYERGAADAAESEDDEEPN